ncbi:hypothetical protein A3860_37840 [Niastella vici]|uniref:Uncharacterized protein n=1 Tax=Niastella vici TaxID=1703345 RepID=A0A1V9FM59_9BACT|nr:hypothetical protein [Niastella vici]OQP59422.1 hypothetical protein A3860_37840 [Niastella vici]
MWSDSLYYLNIFHDEELSVHHNTTELIDFLKTIPELKQTGNFTFSNSSQFSIAIDLILLYTRHLNSWNDNDTDQSKTNLIAIVCTKDNLENFERLKRIFIKIAAFVNWKLEDEHTDDGIENYIIWSPG